MSAEALLAGEVSAAQEDLERALSGASRCRASRDSRMSMGSAKYHEGTWYVLRGIQRRWIGLADEAQRIAVVDEVDSAIDRALTERGPAWAEYTSGSLAAVEIARGCLAIDRAPSETTRTCGEATAACG